MKLRPAYIWFVPILLFGGSTFLWAAFTAIFAYQGELEWPDDYHGLINVYLPMLASLLGLTVAVASAWILRRSGLRQNVLVLSIYAFTFLSWGVVDIHYYHYQGFRCGLQGGESRQIYFTWWFMPQALIPQHFSR
jgi:hypothetical protein